MRAQDAAREVESTRALISNLIRKQKWRFQIERPPTLINLLGNMKTSEFKRFLASKGAKFVEGAKHTKIYVNGK